MFLLPPLYAIVDCDSLTDPASYAERLMRGGIELLQLRAKRKSGTELARLTEDVMRRRSLAGSSALVMINDSVDVCEQTDADGVHLGQEDAAPGKAREILGPDKVIGLSTHNLEQLCRAPVSELSYLAIGPVFSSKTKSGHAPVVGLERLREAADNSKLGLVAIGGITAENAADVYRAGAACVAVIADLQGAADVQERIRMYYRSARME